MKLSSFIEALKERHDEHGEAEVRLRTSMGSDIPVGTIIGPLVDKHRSVGPSEDLPEQYYVFHF